MKQKVSVIIPAYNEEAYIGACLEGLMKQEELPDEIIVVDNNSTDRTAKIAKKYPVRLITEPQQGMIYARNRGFNEATGAIIARTDADTVVGPGWVKEIKKSFKDKKIIAVTGPSSFYEVPAKFPPKTVFTLHKPYFRIVKEILDHEVLYGPNMALLKSAWDKIKDEVCLNDKDVHEDIDLAIHIATIGKIKFDPHLVVNTSFRRFRKVEPYIEYPYRMVNFIRKHEHFTVRAQSTRLVKKIVAKTFY